MFCPKCSQQQVSEETRFCSRCGFHLNVVKALLANDSLTAENEDRAVKHSISKRDMTLGAALMFVFAFFVGALAGGPPLFNGATVFLTIVWLILTLLINIKPIFQYFLKGDTSALQIPVSANYSDLDAGFKQAALPLSQSIPADAYTSAAPETGEMAKPHSVTEQTTNLLKNE